MHASRCMQITEDCKREMTGKGEYTGFGEGHTRSVTHYHGRRCLHCPFAYLFLLHSICITKRIIMVACVRCRRNSLGVDRRRWPPHRPFSFDLQLSFNLAGLIDVFLHTFVSSLEFAIRLVQQLFRPKQRSVRIAIRMHCKSLSIRLHYLVVCSLARITHLFPANHSIRTTTIVSVSDFSRFSLYPLDQIKSDTKLIFNARLIRLLEPNLIRKKAHFARL
jgi:hypothetical protein